MLLEIAMLLGVPATVDGVVMDFDVSQVRFGAGGRLAGLTTSSLSLSAQPATPSTFNIFIAEARTAIFGRPTREGRFSEDSCHIDAKLSADTRST